MTALRFNKQMRPSENIDLFLLTLTNEDVEDLDNLYTYTTRLLSTMSLANYEDIADTIEARVYHFLNELDIINKLITFYKNDISIYPDLNMAGKRIGDNVDKTFVLEDYIELTALSTLCSLLSPIWKTLNSTMLHLGLDTATRTDTAFSILEPLLEISALNNIYAKLKHGLVSPLTESAKKQFDKYTDRSTSGCILAQMSVTDVDFDYTVLAEVMINVLTNINPYKVGIGNQPANIVKYISTRIKPIVEGYLTYLDVQIDLREAS